jgi:hypothetical protein
MAFAAAAAARATSSSNLNNNNNSTNTNNASQQQQEELSVQSLSQRVWTLVNTTMKLESAARGLGGPQDSQALRQTIASIDGTGLALMQEIDRGIRAVRVEILAGTNHSQQRALKSLDELYTEKRDLFVKAVNETRLKRSQIPPPGAKGAGAGGSGGNNPLAAAGVVDHSKGKKNGGGGGTAGIGEINIDVQQFTEVDAAIIEERNQEAAEIAREAVALHKTVQDLNVLVNEQGESLQEVEKNVDHALEHVVAGNAELEVAQKLNASSRKKCCFIWFLIIAAIVAITVPLCLHYISNPFATGGK